MSVIMLTDLQIWFIFKRTFQEKQIWFVFKRKRTDLVYFKVDRFSLFSRKLCELGLSGC